MLNYNVYDLLHIYFNFEYLNMNLIFEYQLRQKNI